ncbi:MAG: hypothetical protein M1834_004643 [Cirrosporium novae-zelandiae]|nr:MAG: hypothetical protein M1834_004643 [Cirrosporium novae-zelandiae]
MGFDSSTEESDDDLEITKAARKDVWGDKAEQYLNEIGEGAEIEPTINYVDRETEGYDERSSGKDASLLKDESSSDDEFGDGEAIYNKFKNRKAVKRKRVAAETRRIKAIDKEKNGTSKNSEGSATPAKKSKTERVQGEESDDEDTLPDYLQKRRSRFERRVSKLKQVGLKLPPDYDDIQFSDDEDLEALQEKPNFPEDARQSRAYKDIELPYSLGAIPGTIAQWLRDYQVQGVQFLHELFVYQKGGILGDDMGLGKTVQVIAFLTAAYGKTGDEHDMKRMRKMRRNGDGRWYPRTLIICPGTLIENWKSELDRWGWWHVDVYHGDKKEEALEAAVSGRTEIMITTYATYRMSKSPVNMVEWDCVIADECHVIKERKSETTQAMNEINALCRIGLTGTAIQNKYEELWCLLNWTSPGRFGPISTWKQTICEPLKLGQSHEATVSQLSRARRTAKKLVENLLPEFFLRRMKTLIADQLPKKTDRVVFCPLTESQGEAYENFLDGDIVQYIKTSTDDCDCGSGKKSGWCCYRYLPNGKKWQHFVFPAISTLQKLSNHLAILIPQGTDSKEKQDKDLEVLQVTLPDRWRDLYRTRESILNYANPEFCGKWKILKKLLRFWHSNGDKVLVFSHSVRLLKMLQILFNHTSYNVSYLDGAMSYEDRARTVDDFNSDPKQFVFLISTRAGGVGLNITSANKVVIVDPNWNPSYDLQAQDRAYRIGQIRDVEVFRLVSAGTIEEIVYARQIYKQQQANIGYNASTERRYFKGVQETRDRKGEIFGLENLFSYEGESIVLRDIINKTNVAESKAGVQVVDLGNDPNWSDDDDDPLAGARNDEDSAMSQLATLISEGNEKKKKRSSKPQTKKSDPVLAILAGAGVEYTHENSEVVGSSKIEARLSRRAEEAGNDIDMGEKYVFEQSQDTELSNPQLKKEEGRKVSYKYHPPQDVIKRQFCTMAKMFGFADATEFALVVEGWTPAQRRSCLDKFYRKRRELLTKSDEATSEQIPS